MPIVDTHAFGETVKLGRFIISLFQYRRCDRQSVSTSKSSSLVLFFPTLFALFALFDTEKNKKRYSTPTTPLRTRTILRSLDKKLDSLTRCVFCRRSLSSWSLFSSLVARVSMVCCASSFYISLEKEELFYSDDYSRAKSARDDAARSASFFEC
jgi:transcription elongation factor Elf1